MGGFRTSGHYVSYATVERWETANFVYNFVQTINASAQLWWQIWPIFPSIFLCGFCGLFLHHDVNKKSKMAKMSNEGEGDIAISWRAAKKKKGNLQATAYQTEIVCLHSFTEVLQISMVPYVKFDL